jgi:glycerol-3-phosphate acyltransferase PlsY
MDDFYNSVIFWTVIAFVAGSLPFSLWIGEWRSGKDIRQVGDGNPGATNALKAGGWQVGLISLFLDILKGALPVALAHYIVGIEGAELIPIGVAPTAGHAFSPFLRGQGGKALAVTFGAWIGLTYGVISILALILLLFWFAVLETDAWSVLFALLGTGLLVLLIYQSTSLLITLVLQSAIILYKHRTGLHHRPRLRNWLGSVFRSSKI